MIRIIGGNPYWSGSKQLKLKQDENRLKNRSRTRTTGCLAPVRGYECACEKGVFPRKRKTEYGNLTKCLAMGVYGIGET